MALIKLNLSAIDSKPPINAQQQKQSDIKKPLGKVRAGGQLQSAVYGGLPIEAVKELPLTVFCVHLT
jgi:hypothetical protein